VELIAYQIQSPTPGPHLLVTGGVHGDEFEAPLAIGKLIERFRSSACLTPLLCGRLTLIPIVNEAAFRRGNRVAADELDLARVCPGNPNGSITEQVATALSEQIRSADYYIDLHSGGTSYSVYPLTGYMLHSDRTVLDQQRAMADAFNLPVVWGTCAELEGRSLSVARDAGIPAIYAEFHGSGQSNPEGVRAYEQGCLNVLTYLGMVVSEPVPSRVVYRVEDPRPASGHMQICYPSPLTGLFEANVQLGEEVKRGDLLGRVWDPASGNCCSIASTQHGLVLTLRTFNRVCEGESLGVILELDETAADDLRSMVSQVVQGRQAE